MMSLTFSSQYPGSYSDVRRYRSPYLSARMAYMSKYLPHLVNREATVNGAPSWSGVNMKSTSPAPVPPERPPKKPHLRGIPQQTGDNNTSLPPPPLPRAPVRQSGNNSSSTNNNNATALSTDALPPPVPNKPMSSINRCQSPDPPPPPPPVFEEEAEVLNDDPLPPPPTEVMGKSRSVSSGLSSYLHKDSYLAQRKERTLGYEGRYRRTLSPSGLGSKSTTEVAPQQRPMTNATSTGKLDSTIMSPSAWEKYHNIRAPNTTVIFTSSNASSHENEIAKSAATTPTSTMTPTSQPIFHRSISWDSNLFNNRSGLSQASIPPPVAQVAPLRGTPAAEVNRPSPQTSSNSHTSSSKSNLEGELMSLSTHCTGEYRQQHQQEQEQHNHNNQQQQQGLQNGQAPLKNCTSLTFKESEREVEEEKKKEVEEETNLKNSNNYHMVKKSTVDSQCQSSESMMTMAAVAEREQTSLLSVSPLRFQNQNGHHHHHHHHHQENKENIPVSTLMKKTEVSLRLNCTSDAASQTESSSSSSSGSSSSCSNSSSNCSSSRNSNSGREDEGETTSMHLDSTSGHNANFVSTATITTVNGSHHHHNNHHHGMMENGEMTLVKGVPSSSTSNTTTTTTTTICSSYKGRQKSNEELQCEELSRDLAKQLPQGDKLQSILSLPLQHKTPADYMQGLFPLELKLRGESTSMESHHLPTTTTSTTTTTTATAATQDTDNHHHNHNFDVASGSSSPVAQVGSRNDQESVHKRSNGHAPLPADSAYFTTSESKAKFLTQYVKDMHNESLSRTDGGCQEELIKQKEELVSRISAKLMILRAEQLEIREEIQSNEHLGQLVVERVKQTAKRNEFDKFKLHVEEIEKITSLLLGLSGRLARAENALMGLGDPHGKEEKKILESKRDKLKEQLDEAKILKENIDRRSTQVSGFLQKYLTCEEYADYAHFVKMKAKLIIDSREIDDKIKLGEEQSIALQEDSSRTSS